MTFQLRFHRMDNDRSRSHDAVIRVYDEAGNVIETHEHAGDLKTLDLFLICSRSFSNTISDAAGWARGTTSNA